MTLTQTPLNTKEKGLPSLFDRPGSQVEPEIEINIYIVLLDNFSINLLN